MRKSFYVLFIGGVIGIFSSFSSESQSVKKKYPKKLDVDWTKLTRKGYQVKYIQLDFRPFPTSEAVDRNILDFLDSDSTTTLNNRQIKLLQELLSKKSNFSEGECGTFYINGGMVILENDTIRGMIDMGCGYHQWLFYPENPDSDGRTFSEKGFGQMRVLLDDININSRKKK